MRYTVVAFMNAATAFQEFKSGDTVTAGHDLTTLHVLAESHEDAAEVAFAIGNRMGKDLRGHEWSPDVRSISVGDVFGICDSSGAQYFLAVSPTGYTPLAGVTFKYDGLDSLVPSHLIPLHTAEWVVSPEFALSVLRDQAGRQQGRHPQYRNYWFAHRVAVVTENVTTASGDAFVAGDVVLAKEQRIDGWDSIQCYSFRNEINTAVQPHKVRFWH